MILDVLKRINLSEAITTHFKWNEALLLREWNFAAYPTDSQKYFIFQMALKLEDISQLFGGQSILIMSWLRPKQYDNFIKHRDLNFESGSRHCSGKAVDFNVFGYEPEAVRKVLLDHLDRLQVRMELETSDWIHLDIDWKPGACNTFLP